MTLNYKGLPYKTEWVEYPDIKAVGERIGAKPTILSPYDSGMMLWTCPMLIDPNRLDSDGKPTVLSDSIIIAKYLDEVYPDRKVIPDGTHALHAAWLQFIDQNILGKLAILLIPDCANILGPRGREYYITNNEKCWGPLSKMCPDREQAWKDVREGLNTVAAALDANGKGEGVDLRVIPGQDSYADFAMIAPFLWAELVASREELDMMKGWNDGRWGKLLNLHAGLLRVD